MLHLISNPDDLTIQIVNYLFSLLYFSFSNKYIAALTKGLYPSAPPPPPTYSTIYPNLNDFDTASTPSPPGFKSDFSETQFTRPEHKSSSNDNGWSNFMAGAALGSAGTYLWNRMSPSLNDPTSLDNDRHHVSSSSSSYDRVTSPKKTATGFATTTRR